MKKSELCVLCGKNPYEMLYAVDLRRAEKPICGACFGRWEPPRLDDLLGVKQPAPVALVKTSPPCENFAKAPAER